MLRSVEPELLPFLVVKQYGEQGKTQGAKRRSFQTDAHAHRCGASVWCNGLYDTIANNRARAA